MQRCFDCQKELVLTVKPGRRDTCPHCQADLHCCFNCRQYSPTVSQQCAIPTVEWVKNKKNSNFCEFFEFRSFHKQVSKSSPETVQKKWDDLFKGI